MDKKAEILRLYYEEHQKQTDIAKALNIRQSYVSKIIKQDEKYADEKKNRTAKSILKKKEYNKMYHKAHPKQKKDTSEKEEYERMQAQLAIDINELSSHYNDIPDLVLAKWIPSAYHSNKSGNLLLDKALRGSFDLPKIIRRDAKVCVQHYKRKYVFN